MKYIFISGCDSQRDSTDRVEYVDFSWENEPNTNTIES